MKKILPLLLLLFRLVAQPILAVIIGHAFLYGAHAVGWYPDQQLGGLFARAVGSVPEGLAYALTLAVIAIIIWGIADIILYRRPRTFAASSAAATPGGLDNKIEFEWHPVTQATVPESGRYYAISLVPLPEDVHGGGPGTSVNAAGSPITFPYGQGGYECRVVNHDTTTIFNPKIELACTFYESIEDAKPAATVTAAGGQQPKIKGQGKEILSRPWRVSIPKIEPGSAKAFVFYLSNPNECFVRVRAPTEIRFLRLGASEEETAKLVPNSRPELWFSPPFPELAPKPPRAPRPKYLEWDKAQEIRLIDLAYLFEDVEPSGYDMPLKIRGRFDKLSADAQKGTLKLNYPDDARETVTESFVAHRSGRPAEQNPEHTVSRADAKSYALGIGEYPPFLFPTKRV